MFRTLKSLPAARQEYCAGRLGAAGILLTPTGSLWVDSAIMDGPYHDAAGDPVLRNSFAVFIDSLGTKQRAMNLNNADLRLLVRWQNEYRVVLSEWGIRDSTLLSFTDNVVVGMPSTDALSLFALLNGAATYQLGVLLHAGLLCRGAIAEGPLYVGPTLAHGAALVQAVELECEDVKVPRIALSAPLGQRVTTLEFTSVGNLNLDLAMRLLLSDSDGLLFVNYLALAFTIDDIPHPTFGGLAREDIMREHADLIEQKLSEPESQEQRQKFLWMADYHDHIANETGVGRPIADAHHTAQDGESHTFEPVLGGST